MVAESLKKGVQGVTGREAIRGGGGRVRGGGWIVGGGPNHAAFCQAVTAEEWMDFAAIAGLEVIRLGADLNLHALRNELRWNDAAFQLGR